MLPDPLLALTVAIAAFVQGSVGIGFALIVAPLIALRAPALLPAALLLLMLPLNLFIILRERGHIDRGGVAWISGGRLLGTLGGLAVLALLSPSQLNRFVGIATLAAVAASVALPAFRPTTPAWLAAGLITGVTETATGVGGPPLALVMQHHAAPAMRATVASCFLIGELMSLALLLADQRLAVAHLVGALALLPPLAVGVLASRWAHHRIRGPWLRRLVLGFASISGLILLR